MNGGHFSQFKQAFKSRLLVGLILNSLIICTILYFALDYFKFDPIVIIASTFGLIIVVSLIVNNILSKALIKPLEYLAQAIFHISPNEHLVTAPNLQDLTLGRTLIETLTRQIYDYSSITQNYTKDQTADSQPAEILQTTENYIDQLPVSVFGLNKDLQIKYANSTALDNFKLQNPIGSTLDSQLKLKFANQTLVDWIEEVSEKSINSNKTWHKVDVSSNNGEIRSYFDISVIYRQNHASGTDIILVLSPQDEAFIVEESALNLIALSVHEIRTPLTILRGYVDVLKEELEGNLDDQTKVTFERLKTSSENLATFISNVLNVVKDDQNQLHLQLQEADWTETITKIVNDLNTRATVRDKKLHLTVAKDLPTVAVDKSSIHEVIANLIDNSIKYSTIKGKDIYIDVTLEDNNVLTTVRDEGVGIPDSVVPNLFSKFHRNHRNSRLVTGTGLGLFISKAIVSAHHGNIWVKSKEGEGTTVGFTLIPYSQLADILKAEGTDKIQVSHGWIKNHSMQRR